MDHPAPVSFRRDVIPAFSQAGCNTGACHGTPTGKGGFRLSLRGYLPDQDFLTLSREVGGRRINPFAADTSLLLRKPLGEVPHEGGLRLTRNSKSFEFIHDWIAGRRQGRPRRRGGREARDPARVARPRAPRRRRQQLVVLLHMADGTVRDVTPICYYDSSSPEIAEVDAERLRPLQEPRRGRRHRPLPQPRRQHPPDPPGRGARLQGRRGAPGQRRRPGRLRQAQPDADQPVGALHRPGVHPPRLPRHDRHPADAPRRCRSSCSTGAADRRDRAIDRLLDRPEFYDFWALKFADILRSNGRLIQPKGAYVFHRWIRSALERNMPMDQFVRALLTTDGSTYANPAANYYRISRDPENAVETTAQLFLGVRIQCAKCHNHPFEKLDPGRLLRLRRLLLAGRPEEGQPAGRGGRLLDRTPATSASRGPGR